MYHNIDSHNKYTLYKYDIFYIICGTFMFLITSFISIIIMFDFIDIGFVSYLIQYF